jgi:hypothetical protein
LTRKHAVEAILIPYKVDFKPKLIRRSKEMSHHSNRGKNKEEISWVQVVHAYNPSYSVGRYQEDHISKPAQANSS